MLGVMMPLSQAGGLPASPRDQELGGPRDRLYGASVPGAITDSAIAEAFDSVKLGNTEMDLAAAVTGGLYRLGANSSSFYRRHRRAKPASQRRTDRSFPASR